MRVWHVSNIGVGRLISWSTIKKHHHGRNVCDPCVPLVHIPAAVDPARVSAIPSNEFVPKIHRSHRNVKKRKDERKMRRETRKRTREHNYHKQVEDFKTRVDEVRGITCQWCSQVLSSIGALRKHQQHGCTHTRGRMKKERTESSVVNSTPRSPPRTEVNDTEVVVTESAALPMGYAWVGLRDHVTETVGTRATMILEQAFQRGIAKGGDRQSCFQMVSVCIACVCVSIMYIIFSHKRMHQTFRKNVWRARYLLRNESAATQSNRGCPQDW